MELNKIYHGDVLDILKTMSGESVNCIVTSPPYYGLRDYGTAKWEGGDENCDHEYQMGGRNPQTSGKQLTNGGTNFSQYKKVCAKCGAIRIDDQIGIEETPELYVQKLVEVFRECRRVLKKDGTLWLNLGDSYNGSGGAGGDYNTGGLKEGQPKYNGRNINGLKPKDLIGIPWRVAFALQSDGWWLRQDIIWCLSGGSWVYAKTQKGEMPIMVRDLIRLKPDTVKLWNGKKWTRMLGVNKSRRKGDELEIVLRSGERISATPTHKFPTKRGLLASSEIKVGDILESCLLPEPEQPLDCSIDFDAAWLAGLYIAEGSMSDDTIQIAGHSKETDRWIRVQQIAKKFGGSATITNNGNSQSIRIYGKVLVAILDELVSGKTSIDKCFSIKVWRYSNEFINAMLDGYLSGDGHNDKPNNRWRLGFCRNYNLERDLRTACARLGYKIVLKPTFVKYDGKDMPVFRGEIRKERSGHFNEKNQNEVTEIRKARCRYVYDLGVEDDPHLFALTSGVLTHNSKPNPMPESVKDRCTKAHEYIFLMTKSAKYWYDADAIKEDNADPNRTNYQSGGRVNGINNDRNDNDLSNRTKDVIYDGRNKRSVWTITTKPFTDAHFAVFPPELPELCIKAGCPKNGVVLDPFFGSGTTGIVAKKLNRNYIGIELNPDYIKIAEKRFYKEFGLFNNIEP